VNQGMAGLIIGAVFGLVLGFFLAPSESSPIPGVDGPDLACLEDRQALAAEVRNSLARMADAGCACDEAILEPLPSHKDDEAEGPKGLNDAGAVEHELEPLSESEVTESTKYDAGVAQAAASDESSESSARIADNEPRTKPAIAPITPLPSQGRQWMVQLVATPESSEAQRIAKKAQNLSLPTVINHELVPALGKKLYKVRVGPFDTKLEGKEAMKKLKDKAGISDCWLHPKR